MFVLRRHRGVRAHLLPAEATVTQATVDGAHAAGLDVTPWTVNDGDRMCALIEMGVDGTITDDPALLLETLERCR